MHWYCLEKTDVGHQGAKKVSFTACLWASCSYRTRSILSLQSTLHLWYYHYVSVLEKCPSLDSNWRDYKNAGTNSGCQSYWGVRLIEVSVERNIERQGPTLGDHLSKAGLDLGGGYKGCTPPPPSEILFKSPGAPLLIKILDSPLWAVC